MHPCRQDRIDMLKDLGAKLERKSLDDIVRCRHDTGAYGNAHLRMASATVRALKAHRPAPAQAKFAWNPTPPVELTGIPIIVDDSMPTNEWLLEDRTTGCVLARYRIDINGPLGTDCGHF